MAKDFLIIGDSNVTRHYTRLGFQVQNVSVVQARNKSEVISAFESIKASFKIIVFACLTNLIIAAGEEGSTSTERLDSISDCLNTMIPMMWYVCPLSEAHISFILLFSVIWG